MAEPNTKGRRSLRLLLGLLALLIIGFVVVVRYTYREPPAQSEVNLSRLFRLADSGELLSATLLDEDARIVGSYCSLPTRVAYTPETNPRLRDRCPEPARIITFRSTYPRSDVVTQDLVERIADRAPLAVQRQVPKTVAKLVTIFIFPLAMLANLFGIIFVSKGGDSSIGDIVGFGRIGRRRQKRRRAGSEITFSDVGGADEAVAELREVTDYLTDPTKFEAYGAAAPKGVLLFGPPGCGKTLLARATAGESGVAFFSISGADFVESLVGVGAARVRDLFKQVREVAPAIVFIDEIDAVGRRREGEGMSGGEREQTVNQLLVEMDGFEVSAGIVVMGATNRPDILDPALLRPGRFDRHVTVTAPDLEGRKAILELHAHGKPLASEVDFGLLARRTPGFTGADLANVVNEAALLALREGEGVTIGQRHLSEAVLRVLHGPQRRGRLMTPEERQRLAVHEGGHAVVSAAMGHAESLHRVSIVARGKGLGSSMVAEENDRVLLTATQMRALLAIALSGLAAEIAAFGESSTTAEEDVERATGLARQMVGLYGMSTTTGRLRLLARSDGYLGGEATLELVSGQTMVDFDNEVKALMAEAEATAGAVLADNWASLERIVAALDERETLESHELGELLSTVRPAERSVSPASNGDGNRDGRSYRLRQSASSDDSLRKGRSGT